MEFVQTFFLAVLIAFIGFVPPGMINMTALKRSLELNRKEATLFILGAVAIILIQAFLAVTFAKYLVGNPQIVANLTYAAIIVFLLLSVLFFAQARRKVTLKEKKNKRNSFMAGLTMASMNMLAIPFFLGYSTLMEAEGWMNIEPPHNYVFSIGAMIGAFGLFFIYVLFAEFIQRRVQFVAKNINYILSLLFLVLALITIYNTYIK